MTSCCPMMRLPISAHRALRASQSSRAAATSRSTTSGAGGAAASPATAAPERTATASCESDIGHRMPRRRASGKGRPFGPLPGYNRALVVDPAVPPVLKPCPHCEKQHRPETRTCPTTGKSIANPAVGKTIIGLAAPPSLAMPAGFPNDCAP